MKSYGMRMRGEQELRKDCDLGLNVQPTWILIMTKCTISSYARNVVDFGTKNYVNVLTDQVRLVVVDDNPKMTIPASFTHPFVISNLIFWYFVGNRTTEVCPKTHFEIWLGQLYNCCVLFYMLFLFIDVIDISTKGFRKRVIKANCLSNQSPVLCKHTSNDILRLPCQLLSQSDPVNHASRPPLKPL